jgi:hypothetical protein
LAQPLVGWVLAAVSLLAGVEAFGLLRRNWLLLWPGVLVAAGLAGLVVAVREARQRGLAAAQAVNDARLRPLLILASLAAFGGLGEVHRAIGPWGWWAGFIWPACLVTLGFLCLPGAAEAEGANAARDRRLGLLLLLAGALRAFEAIFGIQPGAVGTGWFVVLFAAALLWLRGRGRGEAR